MMTKTLSLPEQKRRTRRLTLLAIFLCLELLLFFTPLGFIPIGPVNATTLHLPVILAGIILGPAEGAGIGFVFGLMSLLKNTMAPTVTSFVFSPFYSFGDFHGNGWSVWIAIGPRILLGLLAAWLFRSFKKLIKNGTVSAGIAAAIATFLHTFLVMGSIYLFFGKDYAAAQEMSYTALLSVIGTVIFINGIPELIIAALVAVGVYRVSEKRLAKIES